MLSKSTFISVVSEAKPNIANYHFTTLTPVLGVVRMEEGNSFVIADIPGLKALRKVLAWGTISSSRWNAAACWYMW